MDRVKISDGNFQLEFPSRGKHSIVLLHNGEKVFTYGRVLCGKFSEVGALGEKFRLHPNQDSLSAEIESVNVIPFGCEYEISRDITAASHFLRITDDIRAVNFGRVGDVVLEEVRFPADALELEYMVYGETDFRKVAASEFSGTLYSGTEPVIMTTVTLKDKSKIDFGCGSDVWRLCSARNMAGVSSIFSICCEDDEIVLRRQPLIYGAEVEIEQRPWRFKSIVSWRGAEEETELPAENIRSFANAKCMLAPAARRDFRKQVRRSSGDVSCTGSAPCLCTEASHLEKPDKKELCHFDLEEYITSFIWANRQLNKTGRKFTFSFAPNMFSNTAAVKNLSSAIRKLDFETDDAE